MSAVDDGRNELVEAPGEERMNVPVEDPGEGRRNVPVEAVVHHHGENNRELQEQLRRLQREAFQLASFYFMFQGVIFTAFYITPSDLRCHYRWIFFTLSLVVGFLNLCALSYVTLKYKTTSDDMDKATTSVNPSSSSSGSTAVRSERFRGLLYVGSMTLLIGFFVIITLIGSRKITCPQSERPAKPPSPATT